MACTIDSLYDDYLNIQTQWEEEDEGNKGTDDHNYEVTSYFFLERLFKAFPFSEDDHIVDFGCGKGRVLFMAAHNSCRYISGIENHKGRYEILKTNIDKHQQKHGKEAEFNVHNIDARSAPIDSKANKFFFFEPFSLDIFKLLMQNIIQSIKDSPRDASIFLYLPHAETLDFFDSLKIFKKEIYVNSSLFYLDDELVSMPQFAIYSNFSMADLVNPEFLLY